MPLGHIPRDVLMAHAKHLSMEAEALGYEYWRTHSHIQREDILEGCDIQIEIEVLEKNRDYIRLDVAVDDIYQARYPASYSVVVRRRGISTSPN